MNDHRPFASRGAVRFLIGPVAALCLAVPVGATPGARSEEKKEAAKVAKKVDKAQATAHQAEGERDALRQFQEDVEKYAALHARQLAKVGSVKSVASQKALARSIAAKRAKAEAGDIFQPAVQPILRRLIAEQLQGPDALDARKAALEGNPGEGDEHPVAVEARVNGIFPPGASRSTMPPSVLATLPALPKPLHYRFAGRDLILVDSVAGLIVDVLPAAAPDLPIK